MAKNCRLSLEAEDSQQPARSCGSQLYSLKKIKSANNLEELEVGLSLVKSLYENAAWQTPGLKPCKKLN